MAERNKKKKDASEVVVAQSGAGWSELYKSEDYWAIWIGFIILAVGLAIFLPRRPVGMSRTIKDSNQILKTESGRAPFKTVEWYDASDKKMKLKATDQDFAKTLKTWTSKPHGWKTNPMQSLILTQEQADAKNQAGMKKYEEAGAAAEAAKAKALTLQSKAEAGEFKDKKINDQTKAAIADWRGANNKVSGAKKKTTAKPYVQWKYLIGLCVILGLLFSVGMRFMGQSVIRFLCGFPFVFLLAVISYMMEGQATMKEYGIGYAAWAILFGLIISNTIGTPKWIQPAVQTEYYIKTGLVLLGAELLMGKILSIGVPGIFVAWVVTPIVLITTFIFGQKVLKIASPTLNITISADMSVCGVSAAIATASACRAKKEELTLAVGLSLVFTSIMMIVIPQVAGLLGMDHVLAGAWMGGTIDSTGAVAAAGGFLSDRAMYVAATIKMIQNVLIGVIAFGVALYWVSRYEVKEGRKVGAMEIWHRFPKFVIGFILASIVFTMIYEAMGADAGAVMIDEGVIRGLTKTLRGWFFCLAFVSIGLATNFRELAKYFKGGKPLILYVCGQSLNLILTLLMAYLMFFHVFKNITEKI